VDPLADVLDLSRVRGALLGSVRAEAPWGLALPSSRGASFHAITSGTAWLRVGDQAPIQLMPGDLALLPSGAAHRLSSEPDGECRPFDRAVREQLMTPEGDLPLEGPDATTRFVCTGYEYDHDVAQPLLALLPPVLHVPAGRVSGGATAALVQLPAGEVVLEGPGATTTFVCAGYEYDHDIAQPLLALLPPVLHVPADPVNGGATAALVQLLAGEVGLRDPGARAAVDRLIDLLLIGMLRAWATANGDRRASWLSALRDPTIARALAALHERPAEPWTLAALAAEVNISRATLARRFRELVGEPPLSYLTRWRLDLAARRLKDTDESIDAIARAVGYSSEYAFNRAFRRHRGMPPGRFRRAHATRPIAGTAGSTAC
jgi:AraC-like DNA-binding protein